MKKVLVLQSSIPEYRVPFFNGMAEKYDLTVGFTDKFENGESFHFQTIKLDTIRIKSLKFVPFLFRICKQYDAVMFSPDLHCVSYCLLPLLPFRKFKTIAFTIGLRCSYTRAFDLERKHEFLDHLLFWILQKSEACLFYMRENLKFWKNKLDSRKMFFTNNTVQVIDIRGAVPVSKTDLLFIGSLYREKGIIELLDAYSELKEDVSLPHLHLVGGGAERKMIEEFIEKKGLSTIITLHGPIYDEKLLASFFQKSLACISPRQAGLSVLKSFGYGVPFITMHNGITGGERLNIIDGKNGVIYNKREDLKDIIVDITLNREKYIAMGRAAMEFYYKNTTMTNMIKQGILSIEYALKQ